MRKIKIGIIFTVVITMIMNNPSVYLAQSELDSQSIELVNIYETMDLIEIIDSVTNIKELQVNDIKEVNDQVYEIIYEKDNGEIMVGFVSKEEFEKNRSENSEDVINNKKESQNDLEVSDEQEKKVINEKEELSLLRSSVQYRNVSLLGHLRNVSYIASQPGEKGTRSKESDKNKVYYIKQEAHVLGEKYYLLSLSPSRTKGLLGWVNSKEVSVRKHHGTDKQKRTLEIVGKGRATSKAWGGSKDVVHKSVEKYKGSVFYVDLTEKVGSNTWYRGKINNTGSTIWLHSSNLREFTILKNNTSLLGHLRNNSYVYKDLTGIGTKAREKDKNKVYYIKQEAIYKGEKYFLLSLSPSRTKKLFGWVKESEVSFRTHKGVDKKRKTFKIKGNGKATSKAWGGNQDTVHNSLTTFKGKDFNVNLTEKVGVNVWYRGKINNQGNNVWLHSSQVEETKVVTSRTSLLAHLRSTSYIAKNPGEKGRISKNNEKNKVYYVKLKALVNNKEYYLLANSPSYTNNLLGWVESSEVSYHTHIGVDKKPKKLEILGTGRAMNKAWGGNQDVKHSTLSNFRGQTLYVNLTEKVGSNIWYRGKIEGKGTNIWLHSSQVIEPLNYTSTFTNYDVKFNEALNIQLNKSSPLITAKHAYVMQSDIVSSNQLKANAGVYSRNFAKLNDNSEINRNRLYINEKQKQVKILETLPDWYRIETAQSNYVKPTRKQLETVMDPVRIINDERLFFQFLKLSKSTGYSASELNKELRSAGTLTNMGQAFRTASNTHGINELYLIAHSRLETGNGHSELASGRLEVGLDRNNNPQLVTNSNRNQLRAIKNVYNMFGIGAYDGQAKRAGAIRAYQEGWYTPHQAIVGGAKWIGQGYIYNQYSQDTLYKMRWNPSMKNHYWKQYATDSQWAEKQANILYNLYTNIGSKKRIELDIARYK